MVISPTNLAAYGRALWWQRGIGVTAVVAAVLGLRLEVGVDDSYLVGLLVGGGCIALLLDVHVLVAWRRFSDPTGRPWLYRIADSGIEVRTPLADNRFAWGQLGEVRTCSDVWVGQLISGPRLPIPRAAFSATDAEWIDSRLEVSGSAHGRRGDQLRCTGWWTSPPTGGWWCCGRAGSCGGWAVRPVSRVPGLPLFGVRAGQPARDRVAVPRAGDLARLHGTGRRAWLAPAAALRRAAMAIPDR